MHLLVDTCQLFPRRSFSIWAVLTPGPYSPPSFLRPIHYRAASAPGFHPAFSGLHKLDKKLPLELSVTLSYS